MFTKYLLCLIALQQTDLLGWSDILFDLSPTNPQRMIRESFDIHMSIELLS